MSDFESFFSRRLTTPLPDQYVQRYGLDSEMGKERNKVMGAATYLLRITPEYQFQHFRNFRPRSSSRRRENSVSNKIIA